MRLNAYVLAGDPAWIPQSIGSYYGLVDRIIVSYDRQGRSWSGAPLSVEESLARIRAADPDGKVVMLPGDYADPERFTMRLETEQRQASLDAASEGADWVIQLDTDEIVPTPSVFGNHIARAHDRAAEALDYPARVLYARTADGVFLEQSRRFWGWQAAYPGPVAVRAGTTLSFARQAEAAPLYRVDMAPWNTDPAHPRWARVHAVVRPGDAVLHMSWVRTEAQMAEKAVVSGHASSRDWTRELRTWRTRARHPVRTALAAPFTGDPVQRYRMSRLPEYAGVHP
jgi:hypothetical protein